MKYIDWAGRTLLGIFVLVVLINLYHLVAHLTSYIIWAYRVYSPNPKQLPAFLVWAVKDWVELGGWTRIVNEYWWKEPGKWHAPGGRLGKRTKFRDWKRETEE